MEASNPRKKRPRRSDPSDSEEGEKRRGRPRVEKQDESAADRRRTQIRMAQRAYRQRKESTLEELRKRVAELTNTIELMNKSFSECRDRLFASEISQEQMMDLHGVAVEFEGFVKEARYPNEEATLTTENIPDQHPVSIAESRTDTTAEERRNVPLWLDQSAIDSVARRSATNGLDIGMGYTMYMPDSDENLDTVDYPSFDTQSNQLASFDNNQSMSKENPFDVFRAEVPNETFLPQLDLPRTYSFQETTFGRRIFRATIEKAYQLVLDPSRMPFEYQRCFRLSLMGRDSSKIAAAFKTILDKGPHEELDQWQAPLIHVGGAGTHYARRDPYGNLQPRKKSHNLGIVGPQSLALLENAARDNISTDMTVEVAGFEGEWFDPYDVQGYLEEKGIFIDPSASFAEAEIVEWTPTPSGTSISAGSLNPRTPPEGLDERRKSTPYTASQVARLTEIGADFSQWNEFADMELGAVGFSDAQMGSWMNFLQPGESIREIDPDSRLGQPVDWKHSKIDSAHGGVDPARMLSINSPASQSQMRRKTVIIDVTKFVEVLIVSGVCLGRSPGFRRRDVDRALAISSFDAM